MDENTALNHFIPFGASHRAPSPTGGRRSMFASMSSRPSHPEHIIYENTQYKYMMNWVPAQPTTPDQTIASTSAIAQQFNTSSYQSSISPYILDRGNGVYTRLIPADLLPPLNEVPPVEVVQGNSIVLPGRGISYGQMLTLKVSPADYIELVSHSLA